MPDKETQIKALLWGSAYNLACNTLEVRNMKHSRYSDVFTVSAAEVVEYVLKHGIPEKELIKNMWKAFTFSKRTVNGKPITMKEGLPRMRKPLKMILKLKNA